MSGARLGRYAVYQVRDYLMGRAVGFILFALFLGWVTVKMMRLLDGRLPPVAERAAFGALASQATTVLWLGVFLSAGSMVSNDRTTGAFRFLFAKPVGIPRFYGVLWLLHGALFITIVALLIGLWSAIVTPVGAWPFVAWAALMWMLWGSIVFFFSTLLKQDWLCAGVLLAVASLVQGLLDHDGLWYRALAPVLPPIAHFDLVQSALLRGTAVPLADLAWVVIYGAAFLAAGLAVLRRRPMGA